MTAERQADGELDARFWAIVRETAERPGPSPVAVARPGAPAPRRGAGRRILALALLGAAVAVVIAVGMFRLHLAAGALWIYLGAPALVLAAVSPGDRALERARRRRRAAALRRSPPQRRRGDHPSEC